MAGLTPLFGVVGHGLGGERGMGIALGFEVREKMPLK